MTEDKVFKGTIIIIAKDREEAIEMLNNTYSRETIVGNMNIEEVGL